MSATSAESENLWGYAKRLRFMRNAIDLQFRDRAKPLLSLLDIGCGNGSQLALPLAREGYQLTGIDTDRASIDRARELVQDLPNAKFYCTALDDLAATEPFDVVILSEVLEHLEQPDQLLSSAVKRLAPNGLVLVTVPNGYGEFEWDSWIFRGLRLQKLVDAIYGQESKVVGATDNDQSGHIQFFTRSRLNEMFAATGLQVIREGNGSLACGPLAGHTAGRSARYIEWNVRITERLPPAFASSWYFALTFRPSRGPV